MQPGEPNRGNLPLSICVGLLLMSLLVGILLWSSPDLSSPKPVASPPQIAKHVSPTNNPPRNPPFSTGNLPFPKVDIPRSASSDTNGLHASPELARLEAEVAQMEAQLYAADPLLRSCELYDPVLEEWLSETGAQHKSRAYPQATSDDSLEQRRDSARQKLDNLLGPILMKEFASTAGLAPLARWVLEKAHESGESFFAGADPIIGIDTSTLASIANASPADQLLAEIDARYPRLLQSVEAVAAEAEMPPEVLEAIRNQRVYSMLMDMSRLYVHLRTPPELRTLRENLKRAKFDVEWGASHSR